MRIRPIALFMMALMLLTVFGTVGATAAKPTTARVVQYDVYLLPDPFTSFELGPVVGKISINLDTGQYSFTGKVDPSVRYYLGVTYYDFAYFATAQAAKSGTLNVRGVLTPSELTMVKAHLDSDGVFAVVNVDNWPY